MWNLNKDYFEYLSLSFFPPTTTWFENLYFTTKHTTLKKDKSNGTIEEEDRKRKKKFERWTTNGLLLLSLFVTPLKKRQQRWPADLSKVVKTHLRPSLIPVGIRFRLVILSLSLSLYFCLSQEDLLWRLIHSTQPKEEFKTNLTTTTRTLWQAWWYRQQRPQPQRPVFGSSRSWRRPSRTISTTRRIRKDDLKTPRYITALSPPPPLFRRHKRTQRATLLRYGRCLARLSPHKWAWRENTAWHALFTSA